MTAWIDLAGWTLVHFVWQGALIALGAAIGLRLLRSASAQSRYLFACLALGAMLAAPGLTAYVIDGGRASSAPAPAATGAPPAPVLPALGAASSRRSGTASSPTGDGLRFSIDTLLPTFVSIWLCGVAILLLRLAGGCWRVRRLHRSAFHEPVSQWQATADRLARRLGLARPVFIVDSMRVATPTVIGWIRPVILLPVAAMANLAPAQVEAILAHELAHIRRHDFLVNLLQTAAETLLFYHPATWWLSARIRVEREHCCDDVAVEVCGDPVAYADALTELAAWNVGHTPLAVAATGGSLLTRVRRLLNVPADGTPRSSSGMVVGGVSIALIVVAVSVRAIAVAQPSGGAPPDRSPRFGPPDINEFLGFELFPIPKSWAIDDPRDARAWAVTIVHPAGEMPLVGFTARSLIRHAYGTPAIPIMDGPGWLDRESFRLSIAADPVEAGLADPALLQKTLRQLVEQQLGLAVRREQRQFPAYALVRAGDNALGPRLTPTRGDCVGTAPPGLPEVKDLRPRGASFTPCGIENSFTGLQARNVTMTELAAEMARQYPIRPDRPVVDRTGLTDRYDFTVTLGPLPIAAIAFGHPSVGTMLAPFGIRHPFAALEEQLGLRLEPTTAPFDVLVIERIHRPAS